MQSKTKYEREISLVRVYTYFRVAVFLAFNKTIQEKQLILVCFPISKLEQRIQPNIFLCNVYHYTNYKTQNEALGGLVVQFYVMYFYIHF